VLRNGRSVQCSHCTGDALPCAHHQRRPLRTTLRTSRSKTAPTVARAISLTRPTPIRIPNWGNSQAPIKAPTIPTMMSPTTPKPAPRTSCPASQPATSPTIKMTMRPSLEIDMIPPSLIAPRQRNSLLCGLIRADCLGIRWLLHHNAADHQHHHSMWRL
jgi:hypothetical protein